MGQSQQQEGPYDVGYRSCPCFWGTEPGSLVRLLIRDHVGRVAGLHVLDAGCGEGKNAYYLAAHGATVTALDSSATAISNARSFWPASPNVDLRHADITECSFPLESFDIVIAYGLLHCLASPNLIRNTVERLMAWTRPSGYFLLCSFNSRHQDLSAHPGFHPTLLSHEELLRPICSSPLWHILYDADTDLHEVHPHNLIPHLHSMSRAIARRAMDEGG